MSAKNRRRDRKLRMATRMLETLRRVQLQDPTDHYRQQAMFAAVCALGRTFTRKGWDVRSRDRGQPARLRSIRRRQCVKR